MEPREVKDWPGLARLHDGSHEDCFPCKLLTLHFDTGQPKTHVKKGDPWRDNPVVERIEELKAQGARMDALVTSKE